MPGFRLQPTGLALAALALLSAAPVGASEPHITNLVPVPLLSGVNWIAGFAPDGREAMITLGWRDNGNAHGYDVLLVMMRNGRGAPWNVVRKQPALGEAVDRGSDEISDDPHKGEDVVSTFRLARGRVDGQPATLLLVATRDLAPSFSIPDPSRVTFDIYRLEHAPDVGTTPDHFQPILRDRSVRLFCNADMALALRFNLPLSDSYEGARTPTGC